MELPGFRTSQSCKGHAAIQDKWKPSKISITNRFELQKLDQCKDQISCCFVFLNACDAPFFIGRKSAHLRCRCFNSVVWHSHFYYHIPPSKSSVRFYLTTAQKHTSHLSKPFHFSGYVSCHQVHTHTQPPLESLLGEDSTEKICCLWKIKLTVSLRENKSKVRVFSPGKRLPWNSLHEPSQSIST